MKKNSANKPLRFNEVMGSVLGFLNENANRHFNYKQIAHRLGLKTDARKAILEDVLVKLLEQDQIQEVGFGKFKLNQRQNFIVGILDRQSVAKKTLLIPEDGGEKVFIAERSMNCALHGDKVKVLLYARRKDRDPEGEVVEVLERSKNSFVGTLEVHSNFAFLNVDKKQLFHDIFIPLDKLNGGKNGQKAIAKIVHWTEKEKNPIGEVVIVLGDAGDNNTEMHAILAEFGLPYSYPKEIEDYANTITDGITEEEIAKRCDMRGVPTFTIDPRDAKDFDDALSIREIGENKYEVGVHIADVTFYVEEGDIIDKEGEERATSIYLVDRTIPMLPEHLSNGICSLRPNEEKLCYSCVFEIDNFANISNYKICRTVILSDKRYTYEEAQEIIERDTVTPKEQETFTNQYEIEQGILILNKLAEQLRAQRFAKGAIAFDRVEVRFEIDEKGKPVSVFFKEAKASNKLIEEFMLLANRYVATHVGKKTPENKQPKPFVYRIHDLPIEDKLNNFAHFIKKFGLKLKTTGKNTEVSSSINNLLDTVQGRKEQNLVETLAIRSMAKAIYSTKNIGHYGLAFDYYSHFTSPIRRYPDMMAHRLLTKYLNGGKGVNPFIYEEKCEHSSKMEQLASQAERASIKYKQVEYMSQFIGQSFDGVISGVSEWGVYVEIVENKCEGMIPMRELGNDYYVFDEKSYAIVGRRSGKRYQLGDPIVVKVAKTNLDKKQLDFVPDQD